MSNERWKPVASGGERVIMCECGDESCYKALVVTDHGDQIIEIYADWSDKCEPDFKLFDMPEGYSVCERAPYDPQSDSDESNADRYYRGFNDGYEYAKRQEKPDE